MAGPATRAGNRAPWDIPRGVRRIGARIVRSAEALAHARVRPSRPSRPSRREGLITGPLLIITGIAALLGIAVVSLLFQKELSATFIFLFTSMPRFEAAVSADGTVGAGNALYEMYLNFRTISFFVMSVAIIVAGLSFGLESINVIPPRVASGILGSGILYLIVIMVFPHFWDIIADAVEWSSLWILSPDDPSRAHETVATLLDYMSPGQYPEVDYARLFGGAGSAIAEAAFSSIVDFVTMREGDGALQAIGEGYERTVTAFLTEVLLFFLKAIALLTMALTAFLLGTVRYVLTGLLAVAVPLIMALSLLPQFSRVTALMRDSLVALTIVPLFSALAVAAGVAVLEDLESEDFGVVEVVIGPGDVGRGGCAVDAEDCGDGGVMVPPPAVQELTHGVRKFFMALAVLALAIYFPAMLAPMISKIMSSVQQHVSTTGLGGTILLSGMRGAASYAPAVMSRGYGIMRDAGTRFSDYAKYGGHAPPRLPYLTADIDKLTAGRVWGQTTPPPARTVGATLDRGKPGRPGAAPAPGTPGGHGTHGESGTPPEPDKKPPEPDAAAIRLAEEATRAFKGKFKFKPDPAASHLTIGPAGLFLRPRSAPFPLREPPRSGPKRMFKSPPPSGTFLRPGRGPRKPRKGPRKPRKTATPSKPRHADVLGGMTPLDAASKAATPRKPRRAATPRKPRKAKSA